MSPSIPRVTRLHLLAVRSSFGQSSCTFWKSDRGDAPIPPLTRAKARLARTATPTSFFSVPVPRRVFSVDRRLSWVQGR